MTRYGQRDDEGDPEGGHAAERRRMFEESRGLSKRRTLPLEEQTEEELDGQTEEEEEEEEEGPLEPSTDPGQDELGPLSRAEQEEES
jgi:hypothetical protein